MLSKYFYHIFVFITGGVIMMLEMAAFRLATPYFGASLFVWANIIGLVMIALALGYYLGGKLADLRPEKKLLMFIVLAGGIIVSFLPLFYRFSLPFFVAGLKDQASLSQSIAFSSFFFIAFLFVLPLTILGIVSPFVIRLKNKEVETTGFTAGSIYAFSTVGSVFGTFFSSFLTIPFWGIKETILFSGFCLILISLIGLAQDLKKSFLFFLLLPIVLNLVPLPKRENLVYEKESFYGLIEVIKDEKQGFVLDINRSGRWSVFHPRKILTGMYFDYPLLLYYLLEQKESPDILIIGHAGGTISRQYLHFFGQNHLKITGVELDPEVTKTAYRFFDLGKQKGLKIVNADGRIYLQGSQEKYDLIFSDAYIGSLYLPYQLATKEFFDLAKSRLKEGGIFAIMVLSLSQNPEKERVFQAVSQTVKSSFQNVYFFPSQSKRENIIVASQLPLKEKFLNLTQRTDIPELKEISQDISKNFKEIEALNEKYILRDNRAPIELLSELDKFFIIFNN